MKMPGPLSGVRIIEMGGIGAGPFTGMLLADHGAEVIRIERPGVSYHKRDVLHRSRKLLTLDLKLPGDVASLRTLAKSADALIESFRPGVMERLGLGPEVLCADNPKLVFARLTGWGQNGPYADKAGHDINYLALAGALAAIGSQHRPSPPLALIGNFGGGGMLMAFAICAAILSARETGRGQIVDGAIYEGASLMMTSYYGHHAVDEWKTQREANFTDGGAHYYNAYETADGRFISIGAYEPQFYNRLLSLMGLEGNPAFADHWNEAKWPSLRERFAALFATKTFEEWSTLFDSADVCFAPVLTLEEAPKHPHAVARGAFVELDDIVQPAPAPHFSATPLAHPQIPTTVKLEDLIRS